MFYKVGVPGWKFAAKLGIKLRVEVEIAHDAEADVFIALSPNLRGLVVEAETFEDLLSEVKNCSDALLREYLGHRVTFQASIRVNQ